MAMHSQLHNDIEPAKDAKQMRAPELPLPASQIKPFSQKTMAQIEGCGISHRALREEPRWVQAVELSDDVERWLNIYWRVGHRGRYLWKWCRRGADVTTLPCVRREWLPHLCDTKVLSIMLCVLLDDAADVYGSNDLLECLFQVVAHQQRPPTDGLTPKEADYVNVTIRLTDIYESRIRQYPVYKVFQELLNYDLMQYLNTMRFSHLLNTHLSLLNSTEHDLYLPHAMHMMSFATLDLMCSPSFQLQELGRLREIIWHAQCMGRIGNLLSTWEREIPQRDFTSGLVARAVMQGDVTIEQLNQADPDQIVEAIRNGGHEDYFLKRWQYHKECLGARIGEIESVPLQEFLDNQVHFLCMHLSSRGMI